MTALARDADLMHHELIMEQQNEKQKEKNSASVLVAVFAVAVMIALALNYHPGDRGSGGISLQKMASGDQALIEEMVLPRAGVVLPVSWGTLGRQLVEKGVIDKTKFKDLYRGRWEWTSEYEELLLGQNDGNLKITKENAGYLLNLFWALGLANKNPILDSGEMADPAYGGAGNFASTGGWTIAKGDAMDHYSKYALVALSPEKQALVDKISRGIYRPCCGNSTHFPDCNHGMAMLGLLELMASQGRSEEEMWRAALAVNSYWFPDTYQTIAIFMQGKGVDWKKVDPRVVLGADYSSAEGYGRVAAQVTDLGGGGSGNRCGV